MAACGVLALVLAHIHDPALALNQPTIPQILALHKPLLVLVLANHRFARYVYPLSPHPCWFLTMPSSAAHTQLVLGTVVSSFQADSTATPPKKSTSEWHSYRN
ncbi:hypothetical protein BGX38DRAFT_893313 [Terfezia claveryi]|nr:hypothetical protein BGX38DRAFT_893313 [Terfezia claveryi]